MIKVHTCQPLGANGVLGAVKWCAEHGNPSPIAPPRLATAVEASRYQLLSTAAPKLYSRLLDEGLSKYIAISSFNGYSLKMDETCFEKNCSYEIFLFSSWVPFLDNPHVIRFLLPSLKESNTYRLSTTRFFDINGDRKLDIIFADVLSGFVYVFEGR